MLQFRKKPHEQEILRTASLAMLTSLPVRMQVAVANGFIHLQIDVSKPTTDPNWERALLYAFFTEQQLRSDFKDDLCSTDEGIAEGLEFNSVKRPVVQNALHGIRLIHYTQRIGKRIPKQWRYFRIRFRETQPAEEVLDTIQKSLYGEAGSIEASYAVKDGYLVVEFTIMTTQDEEKRVYRVKWLLSVLLFLSRHFGFAPLPASAEGRRSPCLHQPELSEVAYEPVLNRLARENPTFEDYLGEDLAFHPMFEIGIKLKKLEPLKDALLCIDTIRAIRLENSQTDICRKMDELALEVL